MSPTLGVLIAHILQLTTGFVDAPENAGLDLNLIEIFEQSIAHHVSLGVTPEEREQKRILDVADSADTKL